VKLDKHTNTARFKSASGSLQYQLFAASIGYKLNQLPTGHVSHMNEEHISTNVIEEEDNKLAAHDVQAELLRWHHQFGHLSLQKLKLLALLKVIPSNLATAHPPQCAGCIDGALTERLWRTKALKGRNHLFTATKPGECVSVDQLESRTPGFISHFKGGVTKDRYQAATVFVDHFSQFSCIHLQRGLTFVATV
jgi:hypothetical protein